MNNPFEQLGIRPDLTIAIADLDRAYRAAQRSLHRSSDTRNRDQEQARLNHAYRTLKDIPARYHWALESLLGGGTEMETPPDQDFLFEMMEIKEELESLSATEDKAPLEQLSTRLSGKALEMEQQLAQELNASLSVPQGARESATSVDPGLLQRHAHWKYLRRLAEEAKRAMAPPTTPSSTPGSP